MNFIKKKAERLAEAELVGNIDYARNIIPKIQRDLYDIDAESDITTYVTILMEFNDLQYQKHLKVCENPDDCVLNEAHEEIQYFLQKELNKLGIRTNHDAFTREEKERLNDYLDQVLVDLKDLKDGQQIIYDDLKAEIEELKQWFIVGKKNWRQMAVGKLGEMIVGGIISEATAKPILESIKGTIAGFIG